jgi:hypothetical protein
LFYLWKAEGGIFKLKCLGAETEIPAKMVGKMWK